MDGIRHSVEVSAESLYEAVGLAVAALREQDLEFKTPSEGTEFTISVLKRPVEHTLRMKHVTTWAQHNVADGPAGIIKRQKVRKLLGMEG